MDLDWGSEFTENEIDHERPDFKLREIERCQKISAGPNFLVSGDLIQAGVTARCPECVVEIQSDGYTKFIISNKLRTYPTCACYIDNALVSRCFKESKIN